LLNPQKAIVITAFLTLGPVLFGQDFHYRFQLQDVNDPASAKLVTDILRPVFNTDDVPFAVFPAFNDASDLFDFHASLVVTREQLEAALAPHGIVLLTFTKEDKVTPENQKL